MSQPTIDIYTKFGCGYCHRAKKLLDSKGVEYNEFDVTMGGPKRQEMTDRAPNCVVFWSWPRPSL